ncbi:MAG: hypothetical protein DRI57_30525 [Deltaproteobacteria bacterium]|nr:MAG: hypothetical protein DRI57_30525 [Deltaproteobacteria bacterium]
MNESIALVGLTLMITIIMYRAIFPSEDRVAKRARVKLKDTKRRAKKKRIQSAIAHWQDEQPAPLPEDRICPDVKCNKHVRNPRYHLPGRLTTPSEPPCEHSWPHACMPSTKPWKVCPKCIKF